jgi:hypothetical protein
MNITGKVVSVGYSSLISKKTGKPFKVHSVTLDNGQQFEVGFQQPFLVGQNINVEVETKYGKQAMVGQGGSGGAASSPPSVSSGALAFPIPLTSKEQSICRQSALKAAVDIYQCIGIEPSSNMDALAEDIISLAYKFTDFSTGNRETKMVNDKVGK